MIIEKTFNDIPSLEDVDNLVKDFFVGSDCNPIILIALKSDRAGEDIDVICTAKFKCAQRAWLWIEDNYESEGADSVWVGCLSPI